MIPEESALEWAVTKTLVICFLYRMILPSYIGIMISHHKDPCEPMGIVECYTGFWRCSTWQLVSCSLRFQLKPPRVTREVASSFLGHVALGGTKDSAESVDALRRPEKRGRLLLAVDVKYGRSGVSNCAGRVHPEPGLRIPAGIVDR